MIILYNIYNILFTATAILVFSGLGKILVRSLPIYKENTGLFRFILSFSAGFILNGIIISALVFLKILYLPVVLLLFTIAAAISLKSVPHVKVHIPRAKLSTTEIILLIIISVCALIALSQSLLPPIGRDALKYHFYIPLKYIENHGLIRLPSNIYSGFPQYGEAVYILGLALCNDIAAKLFHFSLGIFSALLIFWSAKKHSDRKSAFLVCCIFASTPLVSQLAGWGYIDLTLTFFTLLAVCILIEYYYSPCKSTLLSWSIVCGFSLGTKYTFAISFILFCIFLLYLKIKRKNASTGLLYLIISFLTASAIACPWYAKNLIFTGNPVFPFLYGIFGGTNWDMGRAVLFKKLLFEVYGTTKNITGFILSPYLLAISKTTGGWSFDGILGPAYLLCGIAFIFSIKGISRKEITLYGFCILFYISWFLSSQQTRFLVPALSVYLLAVSISLKRFKHAFKTGNKFFTVVLLIILGSNLRFPLNNFISRNACAYLCGKIDREIFLTKNLNTYPAIKYINSTLDDKSKILFIHIGNAGYYCQRTFIQDSVFEEYTFVKLVRISNGPGELYKNLKKCGITHILLNECRAIDFFKYSFSEADITLYNRFKDAYLSLLYRDKSISLYSIK